MTSARTAEHADAPALPGMDDGPRARDAMVAATRRAIRARAEDGLLTERHAADVQLALTVSEALDGAVMARRGASVALLARELREALARLPEPIEGDEDDDWRRFEDDFRAAMAGGAVAGASPLRDPEGPPPGH